jgi:YebC/PmpR family DNA-binding regulatory protein
MSGHSKWATTKRAKEAVDKKRGKIFTKLANEIIIAAREGGDPTMNFKLRVAIDRARAANVPRENIDRAIKRGTGEDSGAAVEELVYEGFGPAGSAVIVKSLTDNKNRSASEIKHVFTEHGGSIAGTGAVMWMFLKRGAIRIPKQPLANIEMQLIEAGAEDIREEEDNIVIYTKVEDLQKTKDALEKSGFAVSDTDIEFVPKESKKITDESEKEKLENFFGDLDDMDDVGDFYTNVEM